MSAPKPDAVYIKAARDLYTTDDLEIDDSPATSRGDDGTWVAAWVWVADSEVEDG